MSCLALIQLAESILLETESLGVSEGNSESFLNESVQIGIDSFGCR